MKRAWLIKRIFIGLLTDRVNGSNYIKCFLLINQKSLVQPSLINWDSNE